MAQFIRSRVASALDGNIKSFTGSVIDAALIILITANVIAIILESVATLELQYGQFFYIFEVFSVTIFTIEYIIRLWTCVDLHDNVKHKNLYIRRLKYISSPAAIIDLLAILPFFLSFFFVMDLRFLRVFRLLRIFKLTRYSAAMAVLLSVLKKEMQALMAAFFILFMVLILASSMIYLIEHEQQPEAFGSIPSAMWWAMSTLTTVGYGDVTPITAAGKIFGGLITIIGMGMVALPAGILASGFSEQLHRRREVYTEKLQEALADGILTHNEESELHRLRENLGLSDDDAISLLKMVSQAHIQQPETCPHCQKTLLVHTEEISCEMDISDAKKK